MRTGVVLRATRSRLTELRISSSTFRFDDGVAPVPPDDRELPTPDRFDGREQGTGAEVRALKSVEAIACGARATGTTSRTAPASQRFDDSETKTLDGNVASCRLPS